MIICVIPITKQLILCDKCKENLHIDTLVGVERVKGDIERKWHDLQPTVIRPNQ